MVSINYFPKVDFRLSGVDVVATKFGDNGIYIYICSTHINADSFEYKHSGSRGLEG